MTPAEIQETIAAIKDAQAVICIHLGVVCRSSDNGAALARLADARAEESKLFDIILWRPSKTGPKGPHLSKNGEIDRRSKEGRAASGRVFNR